MPVGFIDKPLEFTPECSVCQLFLFVLFEIMFEVSSYFRFCLQLNQEIRDYAQDQVLMEADVVVRDMLRAL